MYKNFRKVAKNLYYFCISMYIVFMLRNPIWISHRGYRQRFCENTFGAFDNAVEHGFTMIETDLRSTADGHIVLYHDRNLCKLGGSTISCIEDKTKHEISKMRYRCGSTPVFFEEFIERYKNCRWVFDIKSKSGVQTINLLQKFDLQRIARNSVFLFDKWIHERKLRKLLPTARFFSRKVECWVVGLAILLYLPIPRPFIYGKTFGVPPSFMGISLFKQKLVKRYHRYGAKVIAFIPKTTAETKKALEAGVDMVLTDYGMV